MNTRTPLIVLAGAAVIAASSLAFSHAPASPAPMADPLVTRVGKNIKVTFRRDALGAACNVPIGVVSNSYNGLSIIGELTAVTDQWLVVVSIQRESTEARVNVRKDEIWIPRDTVLAVFIDAQ